MTNFSNPTLWVRGGLDRTGMLLSSLCLVHCLGGLFLVAVLGLGGGLLFAPWIHRAGFALAMLIAAFAIGIGALQHRRPAPFVVAIMGLTFMGGGLAVRHGAGEAMLTVIGVCLLAVGHVLNARYRR
jgi:hypothetical protein